MYNNTKKNDEAVSPVIGVILMVAITVILAAVIAAFVFGMAGSVKATKIVNINIQKTGPTNITLTNYGGNDVSKMSNVFVKINSEDPVEWTNARDVGTTSTYDNTDGVVADRNHVIVTGRFDDGTTQVLSDIYI